MEQRLPKHILSGDEAERVLNVPDTQTPTGIRDRAMLENLYSTGMRRMELIGLGWSAIEAEEATRLSNRKPRIPLIHPILRQPFPRVPRQIHHRLNDPLCLVIAVQVAEVQPYPTWLFQFLALLQGIEQPFRALLVDVQQVVRIRSGAGAAASGLDAVDVAQQFGEELVMHQGSVWLADLKREDRQGVGGAGGAEQAQLWEVLPVAEGALAQFGFSLVDELEADAVFDDHCQGSANVADDVGGAGFFPRFHAGAVVVAPG